MKTWIALLRGINVVGQTQGADEGAGGNIRARRFQQPYRTYIQSAKRRLSERARTARNAFNGGLHSLILDNWSRTAHVMVISGTEL